MATTKKKMGFNPYYFQGLSENQFNPYMLGAGIYDSFRDPSNYNSLNDYASLDDIGTTAGGNILNTLGNAGIASGNPIGVGAGIGSKLLGGYIDTAKFLGREAPQVDTNFFERGEAPFYDLGETQREINSIRPGQAGIEAFTKTLNPILGIAAAFKSKQNKAEAKRGLRDAQKTFNDVNLSYNSAQQSQDIYNATRDRRNRNIYNTPTSTPYWYL